MLDSLSPAAQAQARRDILDEFGGREELCRYFGWPVRSRGSRKPEILYATVVGNRGQQDVYDLHFAEVYPFVSRIVAADPGITFTGPSRNLSLDLAESRWQRYAPKLRHIVLEMSPPPEALRRPGHDFDARFALEQWTRAQMSRGLQGIGGDWDVQPDDIVLVADSDEIPTRESLLALAECESQTFARVRTARAAGADMREACAQDAKVLLKSQVFEYYADCPTKRPIWWHPDAVLAACVMEGGMDMEDVRTGSSGRLTSPVASRHVHNFGMSIEDIIFKYGHYSEALVPGEAAGLEAAEHEEMRWRACDPRAPELGPGGWHMGRRPFLDLLRRGNARGRLGGPSTRRGLERPFALLRERPELAEKVYWKGHGERSNPFVGGTGGQHAFTSDE